MGINRKLVTGILLAVVVIAAIAFLLLRRADPASTQYTEVAAYSGTIETHYNFSGSVAIRDSQAVAAKADAVVRSLYVEKDQAVRKDDPLLRLSNGDVVLATIDGEVAAVHISQGERVSAGTPLLDIMNFDSLEAIIRVDASDVSAVPVGKEAEVSIDAAGVAYAATVTHLGKQAVETGELNYYEAKLDVPTDARILPGMKVDVRILNERADQTVLLPLQALQHDDYGKPYVNIRDGRSDVISLPVTVGIQDGSVVQITEGLRSGDIVLAPQSNALLLPMMWRAR